MLMRYLAFVVICVFFLMADVCFAAQSDDWSSEIINNDEILYRGDFVLDNNGTQTIVNWNTGTNGMYLSYMNRTASDPEYPWEQDVFGVDLIIHDISIAFDSQNKLCIAYAGYASTNVNGLTYGKVCVKYVTRTVEGVWSTPELIYEYNPSSRNDGSNLEDWNYGHGTSLDMKINSQDNPVLAFAMWTFDIDEDEDVWGNVSVRYAVRGTGGWTSYLIENPTINPLNYPTQIYRQLFGWKRIALECTSDYPYPYHIVYSTGPLAYNSSSPVVGDPSLMHVQANDTGQIDTELILSLSLTENYYCMGDIVFCIDDTGNYHLAFSPRKFFGDFVSPVQQELFFMRRISGAWEQPLNILPTSNPAIYYEATSLIIANDLPHISIKAHNRVTSTSWLYVVNGYDWPTSMQDWVLIAGSEAYVDIMKPRLVSSDGGTYGDSLNISYQSDVNPNEPIMATGCAGTQDSGKVLFFKAGGNYLMAASMVVLLLSKRNKKENK